MIEKVLRHCTEMEVDHQYDDSHIQSTVMLVFCQLLGFKQLPRLKAIHKQKLYRPEAGMADIYENLKDVMTRPIDWTPIRQQFDQMVNYTTALRPGRPRPDWQSQPARQGGQRGVEERDGLAGKTVEAMRMRANVRPGGEYRRSPVTITQAALTNHRQQYPPPLKWCRRIHWGLDVLRQDVPHRAAARVVDPEPAANVSARVYLVDSESADATAHPLPLGTSFPTRRGLTAGFPLW